MKILLKSALAAGLALGTLAAPLATAPAVAQTRAPGVAIVNIPAVVANSAAYKQAEQQRPVTYKQFYDQAEQRRAAIGAQLQPLYTELQTLQQSANPDRNRMQQLSQQIQQIEANGQRELQQILAPVILSQAYVEEQINAQLSPAIKTAADKNGITLVISPDNVLYADSTYNLNQAVLTELDALLPSVQIVPPQGWLPAELREQQAQAQAQQQAAPAAAAPAASGR
ncbi:OmpH family outer membrane protein [Paraurantiacibacter namhicola]|uniref:Outer membrane protein (OmpH-like) n=1 Tax=Paraurantiacibacter namhicola TaxID=645517 RepID=A0A1C7D9W7_9SPHN|nr:OmpH family outer membrane protein [Paraurantiacibacter namhicola]ANU08254.1 Outer membrane protein (OmpH-like) [Paraurantiacibacter namhicola]